MDCFNIQSTKYELLLDTKNAKVSLNTLELVERSEYILFSSSIMFGCWVWPLRTPAPEEFDTQQHGLLAGVFLSPFPFFRNNQH